MRSMRHVDENTMIDLLGGGLEKDDERSALEHLESCETCERAFRRLAGDAERFRARMNAATQHSEELARAGAGDLRAARSQPILRGRRVVAGLAVAALAVTVLIWNRDRRSDAMLASVPRLPEVTEFVQWRNGESRLQEEAALLEGLQAYSRGDMESAIRVLSRPATSGRLETLRSIYLASAFAHQADWRRTLSNLRAVPEQSVPEPWRSDVRWTRYLALRQTSEPAADSLLTEIAKGQDELGARARSLRRTIGEGER